RRLDVANIHALYLHDALPISFIKFGCIKDSKFSERMMDYILYKNLDGKYLTLEDCIKENTPEKTEEEVKEEQEQVTEENKEETRSEEHTSELQSRFDLVCRLL